MAYAHPALGQLVTVTDPEEGVYSYEYDDAGNVTKLTYPNGWIEDYTYDAEGNLVSIDKYMRTTQGMQLVNSEKYVYDETNKLVQGTNEDGEVSLYTYNGLGVRVGRELIVKDNTHGYTDFHKETPSVETGLDKPEVVKENYVVDYTRATLDVLVKEEVGGNTDRWLYGYQALQVKITSEGTDWWGQDTKQDVLTAYTHHDRLGSIVNLTDKYGRNIARADYREYGEIAFFESITVNGGYRRIAPQLVYTNHEYDDVLDLYYAKARFYDPDEKRFLSMDPVKGNITNPLSLVPYVYCVDNPLRYTDPLGMIIDTGVGRRNIYPVAFGGSAVSSVSKGKTADLQIALEALGYLEMSLDENGERVPYGTYGGATSSAIQLFKFNYGGDYTTGSENTVNGELYLKIINVYINKTFDKYSTIQKQSLYNSYRDAIMEYDKGMGSTGGYYPLYQCVILKSAALSHNMASAGAKLVTDHETVDNIIRLDITQTADEMLRRNAEEVLKHRYPTREEMVQQNIAYKFFPQHIEEDYTAHMTASISWLMSKDWHDKDWDIKLKKQYEEQLSIEFLGQQTQFYFHGEKMRPEDLGNFGYAYWASMLGMGESDILAGSIVAGWFGKGGNDDDKDVYYMKKGIEQFRIDYPEYVR